MIEAMKQALEALESCTPADTSTGHVVWPSYDEQAVAQAITALRTAIEQAEKQEPVAWLYRDSWGTLKLSQIMPPPIGAFPVYTTPPAAPLQDAQPLRGAMPWEQLYPQFERATPPAAQRPWVGLTKEDIVDCLGEPYWDDVIRKAEAKLRSKNT